jgi:hypothetical protein
MTPTDDNTDVTPMNGTSGSSTAMTVKELLLEVRGDVKTMMRDFTRHLEQADTRDREIATLKEDIKALHEKVQSLEEIKTKREAQVGIASTVFGPYVVPGVLTLVSLAILLYHIVTDGATVPH